MGQQCDHFLGIELRQPEHPAAREHHAVTRHEQPVHVIDRQRMEQHVAARESPLLDQGQRVAREIAVGEHGALGAPCRPGRVDDRREIIRG